MLYKKNIQTLNKQGTFIFTFFFFLMFVVHSSVNAASKIIVIPLDSSSSLKNVVTVAKKGGDFTDPIAAVNSISDASSSNPYVVIIAPGIYTLAAGLQMKEYVDIAGAGKDVTVLEIALSSSTVATSAMLLGANNATVSDMTLNNTGGADPASIGIFNNNTSPTIRNVKLTVKDASDVVIGIRNENSTAIISDVTIEIILLSTPNTTIGIYNISSSPTLNNIKITMDAPANITGVQNDGTSSPNIYNLTTNVTGIAAANRDFNGIVNFDTSAPTIRHSWIGADTFGMRSFDTSSAKVSFSTIVNSIYNQASSTASCIYTDNSVGGTLNATCN